MIMGAFNDHKRVFYKQSLSFMKFENYSSNIPDIRGPNFIRQIPN